MSAAGAGSVQMLGMFPQNACLRGFWYQKRRYQCGALYCKGDSFLQTPEMDMVPDRVV
jgi:hypothetical protein